MASPPPSPRPPTPPPPPPPLPCEPTRASDSLRRNPVRLTRAGTLTPIHRGQSMALVPSQSPPPPQSRPCEAAESSTAARRYPLRTNRTASTPRPRGRTLELPPPPPSVPPTPPPSVPPTPPPPTSLKSPLDAAQGLGSTSGIEQEAQVIKIPLQELNNVLDTFGVSDAEKNTVINDVSKKCIDVYNRALDSERERCSVMVKSISVVEGQCDELCLVLGERYALSDEQKLSASLQTIHGLLTTTMWRLKELKKERLHNLQAMQLMLIDLWDCLGVTLEEQKEYYYMMRNTTASLDEVTDKDALSAALLSEIHSEVKRLEDQLMQDIKKKFAVLADNLRQTHLSFHEDYELKFNLIDVDEGRVDKFSAYEKLEQLIAKSEKDILRRAEIIDRAEVILNRRKGSRTYDEAAKSLVERVKDWVLKHDTEFIYDERRLIERLAEPETDYHHLTDAISHSAAEKGQSPTSSESCSEGDDDPDFEASESEESSESEE